MNSQEFNAFSGLMGIGTNPTEAPAYDVPKTQHPSANYYDAPTYRGENLADLTDDERNAESVDRSEIDDIKSTGNLTEAIALLGTGASITVALSAYSNPGFGLGVSLVGCLVFATGAAGKNGKADLVRTGAMAVGAGFGVASVCNRYSQEQAIATVNTAVEQFEIPPQPGSTDIPSWAIVAIIVAGLGYLWWMKAYSTKASSTNTKNNLPF
ncbi:hypothetical protein [Tolypothrix sp. VBCCA 56010]|uniref:hypothetical protein n=1 Tax=Tolypothrix sp. VBCCA 56010 TaxID=3137731 RepID=UPI003D7DED34